MSERLLFLIISIFYSNILFGQLPTYLPKSNLIGYWDFSGNANDLSGNNHHGVVLKATSTTDRFGNPNGAFEFNGIDSRISINDKFFNNGWDNYTISFWTNSYSFLNPNNVNDSQIVFNTSPHNGTVFTMYGSNQPFNASWNNKYALLVGSNPSNRDWDVIYDNGQSNSTRLINTWVHTTVVKNNDKFSIYINGVLDKVITGNRQNLPVFTQMVFGNISPEIGEDEGFNGKIDDFAIWNRTLSETEIKTITQGKNNITTDLSLKSFSQNRIVEKEKDGVISFTLKNESATNATNIKVLLKIPYTPPFVVKNSQNCTKGTFDSNMWTIPELAAGDSCVLNVTYQPIQNGVWYVEAEVFSADQEDTDSNVNNGIDTEDDFTRACMSIPIKVETEPFGMQLMIEDSKLDISQWYKNDTVIAGATSGVLQVTSLGRFSYTTKTFKCPTQGCCPFILEKATVAPNCCVPLEYILKK
ncbi:MAG: LamG domain-containing protein [Spirosomataceae bacterium]